jgi:membrane protein
MAFHMIIKRLQAAIRNPIEELSRWERVIRYTWQLIKQGASQLSRDRASMMAASLTYRTLFGLLPVTVVGASVARAVIGNEQFKQYLHEGIAAVGMNEFSLGTSDTGVLITLGSWLSGIVSSGMNIDILALTWIGLGVLAYSAITLLVDIESCFNFICKSKKGRAWVKRIPLYLILFSFGPVLIALALWVDALVFTLIHATIPWNWASWALDSVWGFSLAWMLLVLIYRLVPTVHLKLKSIMIGAFVASLLLLVGKESLGLYFNHAISLKQIYGSLGLVPIFMFWLYLMWLIILLGLQVAAIVHQVGISSKDPESATSK